MKLYVGATPMTSPRKVQVYLAEKSLAVETVALDMRGGAGRSAEYLAKNPAGTVPLLALDDGGYLTESAAIIEYFEELHPAPPLIGSTPAERARTRALDRIVNDFLYRNARVLVNTHPFLPRVRPGFRQYAEVARAFEGQRDEYLNIMSAHLGGDDFFGGEQVSIADCTLFAGMQIAGRLFDYTFPEMHEALRRWYARFAERPSATLD